MGGNFAKSSRRLMQDTVSEAEGRTMVADELRKSHRRHRRSRETEEGKISKTKRDGAANYREPPLHTRFKKGQSGNPSGRPVKNLAALLAATLDEAVTVTENGKRWQISKREAVIAQLVNKSATADLRATKMLIDMLRDIEKKADPASAETSPFSPTDKEVVAQLIARLRRNMCNGCPRAGQGGGRDGRTDGRVAENTEPAVEPSRASPAPAPAERAGSPLIDPPSCPSCPPIVPVRGRARSS